MCAGRVHLEDRRAGSEGRRGAQDGVLAWERQGGAWGDGWRMQGGIEDPLPASSPEPPYCPSLRGPHVAGDLGSCLCHVPSGTTVVVVDGDKSHSPPSSSPHLATVCPTPSWLISPHPGSRGTRAELVPHPMQGKGLPGTALPEARTLPSASGFPQEQQCPTPQDGSKCLKLG